MKVCTNCHLSFPDSASHCTQCGAPLTTVADQPPVYSGDPLDHTAEFDPADISANKVFALIPYLMEWVGVIITLLASSSSPYAGFHVRQALKIQIAALLSLVLLIIPFLGWIAVGVWAIIALVLDLICFFRVCSGKAIEAPIVSSFKFLK